ncbi:MAG TPA: hypothetical protein VIF62_35685 [Labilithrix sp.]
MRRVFVAALATAICACGEPAPAPPPKTAMDTTPTRPPALGDDASWGKYHSKRFQLTIPLPEGKDWKIDDHSRPALFALHDGVASKLWVELTNEDELVNRKKCEDRARALGWVPPETRLSTVEDEVVTGPELYDSRVWVALDPGRPGGAIDGHVFLFGGFLRRCLLVHFMTTVPSAHDEDVISTRLALAETRIVRGIALDPPRTTGDAEVPRDKPDVHR